MITLVDTHMHFHECFRLFDILEGAWRRFEWLRRTRGLDEVVGCLVSTEMSLRPPLELVKRKTAGLQSPWTAETVPGSGALILTRAGKRVLVIVPGKQVVTQENLEVLALATPALLEDGISLEATIGAIRDSGGVPVLPWAFGKWSLERGRVLEKFLADKTPADKIFLGDNGCRPSHIGLPRRFRLAASRGLKVLAGSDPLPFLDHEKRAASYTSMLPGGVDWRQPEVWLRRRLLSLPRSPEVVGRGRSLPLFLHDQLRIHRKKRSAA